MRVWPGSVVVPGCDGASRLRRLSGMDSSQPSRAGEGKLSGSVQPAVSLERAGRLIRLFCPAVDDFALLANAAQETVPQPWRGLLDHTSHMTVVMQQFHGEPPCLRVVARTQPQGNGPGDWYAREILLLSAAGVVWQQGIVRIDLQHVGTATAALIREERIPLGRVLIDAGLLREVQHVGLLKVVPGRHLASLFGVAAGAAATTFGRVAEISLGGTPAVELLEIVAPLTQDP